MAEINVIMLGAKRAGKTSVLASMNEVFDKIEGSKLILNQDIENDNALDVALSNMKNIFSNGKYGEIIDTVNNVSTTDRIRKYGFNLSTVDNKKKTKHSIKFTDIPGEWICPEEYETLSEAEREMRNGKVKQQIAESDVILIALDSVMLMEEQGIYNKFANECELITRRLKSELTDSTKKKMILFVPMKYETYYYSNRGEEVVEEIKRVYDSLLRHLTRDEFKNTFYISITPVLTLGDLIYGGEITKVEGDNKISYKANYKFRTEDAVYSPKFCEQPLIYILLYIYQQIKYKKNGKEKKFKLWWDKFWNEKFNIRTDHVFMDEIEKLQKLRQKKDENYVVLQDTFIQGNNK